MNDSERDRWVDSFAAHMLDVDNPDPFAVIRAMALDYWASSGHREPVNVVQDIMIRRYIDSGAIGRWNQRFMPPVSPAGTVPAGC